MRRQRPGRPSGDVRGGPLPRSLREALVIVPTRTDPARGQTPEQLAAAYKARRVNAERSGALLLLCGGPSAQTADREGLGHDDR
jgi:hypothetical protein